MRAENPLNLNMVVAELIEQYPQVIPVFIRHHMSCVGCSMSTFETIKDAAVIYGVLPDVLLNELVQVIQTV